MSMPELARDESIACVSIAYARASSVQRSMAALAGRFFNSLQGLCRMACANKMRNKRWASLAGSRIRRKANATFLFRFPTRRKAPSLAIIVSSVARATLESDYY
ncbi:MAG: hypothetical protein E6Q88_14680 [Lysobacteraceae bacterium]|nr:MAG: hypothetical protein E6Q88_14680 [Xanthomonadaceae bacterium]